MARPRTQHAPHAVDLHVGRMLRQARSLRDISQQELGSQIEYPVTFQQVQKYERGFNRISVSRLWQFAKALRLPLAYFFPDEKHDVESVALNPQENKLLESYRSLTPELQKTLLTLTQAIGKR